MRRVLLLGGTGEARTLASLLTDTDTDTGIDVVSSLAGRVAHPHLPAGLVRVGGFGGLDGLRTWLQDNDIDVVVDATHPFAAQMSAHAHAACTALDIPMLGLRRPGWSEQPGDRWTRVATLAEAAAALPALGTRCLLTIGRQEVGAFCEVPDVWFLVRAIDPPHVLPSRGELLLARGPFALAEETALMARHGIDVVVTKDSGGPMTAAKLDAARQLAIPVVVVDRPPYPPVATVSSPAEAFAWLTGWAGARPSYATPVVFGHLGSGRTPRGWRTSTPGDTSTLDASPTARRPEPMPHQPTRPVSLHTTHVPGEGSPVVFLHGLLGQGKNFATAAKALAPEHESLLVDLPNHGRSPWTDRVDYVDMADTVAATVRGRLGGRPVALVGHSMGGKVAMVLALRHPNLVERLVVVDISPVATRGMSQFEHLLGALRGLDLSTLTRRADADAALAGAIPDAGVRAFLLQNLREHDGQWRWRGHLDLLHAELPAIGGFPYDPAGGPDGEATGGRADEPGGVPRYDGPVLWIAGADSPYVLPEHAATMRALFPRVRTVRIKNAGHWVHSAQPAAFLTVLRTFLDA